MARQIAFHPKTYDPRNDVRLRLENAKLEHATAILEAYRTLQEAEDHGVLNLLRGAMNAGDTLAGKASEYANTPNGIRTIRNLLALGKIVGTVEPDLLHRVAENITHGVAREMEENRERKPSLWRILRRALSVDALRGLSLMVTILASAGASLRNEKT